MFPEFKDFLSGTILLLPLSPFQVLVSCVLIPPLLLFLSFELLPPELWSFLLSEFFDIDILLLKIKSIRLRLSWGRLKYLSENVSEVIRSPRFDYLT